jgi:long-subunit fatty acid transport protein
MNIVNCILRRAIRRGTEAVITAPTRNRMELERAHVGSNPTSSVFLLLLICLILALFLPVVSFAAAFQLFEVDTAGLGNFHAGGAAEANGASSEYFNPAGVVRIKRPEISFGDTLISADINYKGFVKGPAFSGITPPGGVSSNTLSNVPNFHLAIPLNSRFTFAFGATTPFGLETEFPEAYPKASSQAATFSRLITMNLNPSMAFLINRYFSVAAGLDWIYTKVNYNNVVALPVGITNLKNNVDGAVAIISVVCLCFHRPHDLV